MAYKIDKKIIDLKESYNREALSEVLELLLNRIRNLEVRSFGSTRDL